MRKIKKDTELQRKMEESAYLEGLKRQFDDGVSE